jgi:hypothetical protein
LSDFVTAAADGAHTKLTIDHDGTGVSGSSVTIILKNVAYTANLLTNMIANGNLVLESTGPTRCNRNSNIRMFSTWAWRYPNGVLSLTYFSK